MVSYRLLIFGLGMTAMGILLIYMNVFVGDVLSVGASVATSAEAETSRSIFDKILSGFAWLVLMLGAIFVLAGALSDRARQFT